MKNNNKEKIRKTKITIGTIGLASSVAFGITAPLVINAQKENSRIKTSVNNALTTINGHEVGQVSQKINETPKYLYALQTIDEGKLSVPADKTAIEAFAVKMQESLEAYKMTDIPGINDEYATAQMKMLYALSSANTQANPLYQQFGQEGRQVYSNANKITELFNKMNSFGQTVPIGQTVQPLVVIKPSEIRDVHSAQVSSGAIQSQTLLTVNDFAYKVADIDLTQLQNQKSLAFSFKDKSMTDVADHDYKLIISNENEDVKKFLASPNKDDISSLIANQTIFVRDMKKTADSPEESKNLALEKFNKKIKLTLVGDHLSVLLLPTDENKEQDKALEFVPDLTMSGKDTYKPTTLKYGILDNSIMPNRLKPWENLTDNVYAHAADPISSNSLIPKLNGVDDSTKVASEFSLFSGKGKWNNNTSYQTTSSANWLRLFMGEQTSISQEVAFAGKPGTDAFDSSTKNILKIKNAGGGNIDVDPQEFYISDIAAQANNSLDLTKHSFVSFDSKPISANNPETYAKVDIALSRGIISFDAEQNGDEKDFSIASPTSKIFFEDPFAQQVSAHATQVIPVKTTAKAKVQELHKQLIGDVLANWAGFYEDPSLQNSSSRIWSTSELTNKVIDWPKDSNGNIVFDEQVATSDAMRQFVYQYEHFYLDDQWKIKEDGKQFGLFETIKQMPLGSNNTEDTFAFEKDAQGNPIEVDANGRAIYKHFIDYTSALSTWATDKLNLDAAKFGISAPKQYDLTMVGSAAGFTETKLINNAGIEGKELMDVTQMLVHFWTGEFLSTAEQNLLQEVESKFGTLFKDWQSIIKDKNKPLNGKPVDVNGQEYKISKQYIYAIIQPYFTRMINKVLENETTKFSTLRKLSLSESFDNFFKDSSDKLKINSSLISKVGTSGALANMQLQSMGTGYGTEVASNGLESIKSLADFIYVSGLQDRFLDENSKNSFNDWVENKKFDDPAMFDPNRKDELVKMMQFVSTIMGKTFVNDTNYVAFDKIIENIEDGIYSNKSGRTALSDLSNTIKYAIQTITTDKNFSTLSILGVSTDITYLQSLVIGKNLTEIFKQYLENIKNDASKIDDVKAIEEYLKQQKQYDSKSLTNLAVSLGNYNLDYFVQSLTDSSMIVATANEMLGQDLAKQIAVEIDSENQLVNFLSNPDNLVKYAFIGIGAGATAIGGSIFGLSFRKSVRTSRKNLILERAVFIGIATLGIALALFGIIPGLL